MQVDAPAMHERYSGCHSDEVGGDEVIVRCIVVEVSKLVIMSGETFCAPFPWISPSFSGFEFFPSHDQRTCETL